uniref:FTH domain-containing protein n=1 Tax=Steinernema glaseri TaxID=37863 RepID=A0A1I7ZF65_9BILA
MDTVPVTFCRDVASLMSEDVADCERLPNPWGSALKSIEERKSFSIHISEVTPNCFFYSLSIAIAPPTLKDMLSWNSRLIQCSEIEIGPFERDNQARRAISKERLIYQLTPFLRRCIAPESSLKITVRTANETVSAMLGQLKEVKFASIELNYCGLDAEDLLEKQMINMKLGRLVMTGQWPHPSRTSEMLSKIIANGHLQFVELQCYPYTDVPCNLKIDFSIFKALFDAWVESKGERKFLVEGLAEVTTKEMNVYARDFDSDFTTNSISYRSPSGEFASNFNVEESQFRRGAVSLTSGKKRWQ